MAINPKAKQVIEKYQTLKEQRSTWEDHWQDIANYFLPRKSNLSFALILDQYSESNSGKN